MQELETLLEGPGGHLVVAFPAVVLGGGQGGLPGQQGEVGLATAAEDRGLGGLQAAAGQGQHIQGLARLQEEQQSGHLPAGGNLQGGHQGFWSIRKGSEIGLIVGPPVGVAQEIGTGPEQVGSGPQGLVRVALLRCPVKAQLEGAEHGLGIGGRADTQQPEVVERQIQPHRFSWPRTVVSGSGFDRLAVMDPVQSTARPVPPTAMTQELTAALAAQAAAPTSGTANAVPAAAGSHAERHQSLYPAERAAVNRQEGLLLYRDMTLGRRFEDKCAEMYYRGKMFGFVHLYNGQEAVSTGVIKAMRLQHDWFCSTYRDHVHALSCGVPAREVMSELFGKETGCSKGRGGSMHLFSKEHHLLGGYAFIGEGIPVALGAAFTSRYKRDALGQADSDAVTAAFFGDGTCNVGQFFECLNMATLWKLPILFVVENNRWAIGMDHNRATSDPEIWRKAAAFGMAGEEVDGMDVLAVRAAAQRAIERARAGEGPTLLECLTYRFRGHSLADPDELRATAEKEFWAQRDPIKRLAADLITAGLVSEAELKEIEREVDAEISDCVEFALAAPEPDGSELTRYIWAED